MSSMAAEPHLHSAAADLGASAFCPSACFCGSLDGRPKPTSAACLLPPPAAACCVPDLSPLSRPASQLARLICPHVNSIEQDGGVIQWWLLVTHQDRCSPTARFNNAGKLAWGFAFVINSCWRQAGPDHGRLSHGSNCMVKQLGFEASQGDAHIFGNSCHAGQGRRQQPHQALTSAHDMLMPVPCRTSSNSKLLLGR